MRIRIALAGYLERRAEDLLSEYFAYANYKHFGKTNIFRDLQMWGCASLGAVLLDLAFLLSRK